MFSDINGINLLSKLLLLQLMKEGTWHIKFWKLKASVNGTEALSLHPTAMTYLILQIQIPRQNHFKRLYTWRNSKLHQQASVLFGRPRKGAFVNVSILLDGCETWIIYNRYIIFCRSIMSKLKLAGLPEWRASEKLLWILSIPAAHLMLSCLMRPHFQERFPMLAVGF